MGEILFSCAGNRRAVIATLSVIGDDVARFEGSKDVLIAKSIESATDLHKGLRVKTYKTKESAFQGLEAVIYVFRSRMEALLFLISALLSRGLAIVNLLLCRQAVRNVFVGNMDLGCGMSLKGISKTVEVGFLTLLESLNFCKVGYHLKFLRWPNWVVGSESHYTKCMITWCMMNNCVLLNNMRAYIYALYNCKIRSLNLLQRYEFISNRKPNRTKTHMIEYKFSRNTIMIIFVNFYFYFISTLNANVVRLCAIVAVVASGLSSMN